jgi:hypothetical protein
MQHIAKTPRWVEWPTEVKSDLQKAEKEIIVRKTLRDIEKKNAEVDTE